MSFRDDSGGSIELDKIPAISFVLCKLGTCFGFAALAVTVGLVEARWTVRLRAE